MDEDPSPGGRFSFSICRGRQLTLLFKIQPVFCAQADMLDQEAAFVQIQEAKTMVEDDLQRRLEESEEEKQQLQQMAASAAALEQQLAQAGARGCAAGLAMCLRGPVRGTHFGVPLSDLAAAAEPAGHSLCSVLPRQIFLCKGCLRVSVQSI